MWATNKIVFIDIEKTGCTFVREVLDDLIDAKCIYRKKHTGMKGWEDKWSFMTVRNPLAQYVSLWNFGKLGHGRFRSEFPHKRLHLYNDFGEWLRYVTRNYPSLMTKRINKQIGTDWNVDFIIHQEVLFTETGIALFKCPEKKVEGWRDKYELYKEKYVNKFFHGNYLSLYDDEMTEWVANAERKIIDKYYEW